MRVPELKLWATKPADGTEDVREFLIADVFTGNPLEGNQLGIFIDGRGLSAALMQRATREMNFSETVFFLPPDDPSAADAHVRIFTPGRELPFAGHPTLGSAHAWLEAGGPPARQDVIVQECGAGLIPIRRTADGLAFKAPPVLRDGPVAEDSLEEIAAVLGIGRADIIDAQWADNGPGWVAVELADAGAVLAVQPGPMSYKIGIFSRYPAGSPQAFEVRAFFPKDGATVEDPVTGSLNASLALWLLSSGKARAPYVASQGTALGRRGRVHVSADDAGGIWIGGGTHTLISGSVHL